ncbi:type I glyceraldehyde-3-phosphate dehydrogenase [Candidatus Woesearchaeota archaeon]|nr:type I glyceraldehyde-3-phosphate dehydrogenase [Candidatus Woesearchaeota archaeon]
MMVNVAINGFGRIGRLVFRAGFGDKNIDIIAVNDLSDVATLAHLLKHDSVHGTYAADVKPANDGLLVNGKKVLVFGEKDPTKLLWKKLGVDVVVESTGRFTTKELASQHLTAGAKKVLLSAPAKDGADITIVKGVNEHLYDKKKHHIVSNASCTTNCLAPLIKVLNDAYGVEHGFMITIHAYTADQNIVDGPHKDLRRARSAAVNITPTTTGAAKAVAEVIPELAGKTDGIAVRVPVPDGSIVHFIATLKKKASVDEVNLLFKKMAQTKMRGVIEYSEEDLVSSDIIGNPHSAIFDSKLTKAVGDKTIEVAAWYDNEWGYSNRIIDVVKMLL